MYALQYVSWGCARLAQTNEELTLFDHISQSLAITRKLGNRLAEIERLACPVVHRQRQVMRRDGASDRLAALLDGFHGCCRRRVLQHNA